MRSALLTVRVATLLACATLSTTTAAAGGFVLLRSAKNTTASAGKGVLRELFGGKARTWPNGTPAVVILTEPGSAEMGWLAKRLFGVPERVLRAKIKAQVFAGEMTKPKQVSSSDDCIALLKRLRGGVCAAPAEAAAGLPAGVAKLAIE